MLNKMREQIDKSLLSFLEKTRVKYKLDLADPILFDSIKDFVLRKGKRIRPMLLILCYKGYKKTNKRISQSIYYASSCVELLHNFMLVHDDIIDRSNLRRGKPTMHKLFSKAVQTREKEKLGCDLSIIAGDIIYALSCDAFLSINEDFKRKEEALKYFIQTAVFTAMGEFIDTFQGMQKVNTVKEDNVLLNYTLKTAYYTFKCPMVVGAILAGAKKEDIKHLSDIGLLIGQAFQIQDDVLGIFDSQKNIGKSILSDIAESKKTILVCHAYHKLPYTQRRKFIKCFTKPKKTYQDLITIRKIFINGGSLSYSMEQIKSRLDKANKILSKLQMNKKYHNLLKESLLTPFNHSRRIAKEYRIQDIVF